ncbi:hypothetical protein [Peribacillus frigoritolerans]|uniref:hypothetical protein n=1 Tax=Peribacillus frigoritolerans TaxID=450367 RepID=UPI0020C099C2|nr:hypothetical protein [Peribacillus frigoritolerans]MCK2003760.1 hypothetical protein [Peribacillus frigoritolerans]MEE3954652.1 hypothetical protein [Peribacillus frigoritolerans]
MEIILKKDSKAILLVSFSILSSALLLMNFHNAAITVGISEGLATNIYFALQWVSWGATAAAIVASFGLGAIVAQAIWAAVKKQTLKQFIKW